MNEAVSLQLASNHWRLTRYLDIDVAADGLHLALTLAASVGHVHRKDMVACLIRDELSPNVKGGVCWQVNAFVFPMLKHINPASGMDKRPRVIGFAQICEVICRFRRLECANVPALALAGPHLGTGHRMV